MHHHRAGLARALQTEGLAPRPIHDLLDALEAHGRGAPPPAALTEREIALLGYAAILTEAPGRLVRQDLDPLRRAGLSDAEILEANQVTAYFAYANRVVDGLGVELEPFHRAPPDAER